MTRLFVACLVLFPVIFLGMLVATGTLQEFIFPQVKSRIQEKLAGIVATPGEPAPRWDVVDSLIVAGLEERESRLAATGDSLTALQARMVTERQELARMNEEIQRLVDEMRVLETAIAERRTAERQAFAKIFDSMDPERAAQIIAYLDDESVEFLVKTLKKRQAAEVLAVLSPERAARLSETILTPTDGKEKGVN